MVAGVQFPHLPTQLEAQLWQGKHHQHPSFPREPKGDGKRGGRDMQ